LSRPIEQVERTEGWLALSQAWHAYHKDMDETTAAFQYDHCTPDLVAGLTMDLSYQFPYCIPRSVAVLRTAPFAYWLDSLDPQLTTEEERCWDEQIKGEVATYCDILRRIYGEPDLA
jgi:hypothetical protein